MNDLDPLLYPVDFQNMIIEVWLYVNPIKGTHAVLSKKTKTLAVFINEKVGRKWEQRSDTLRNMVGYHASWDEMLEIASRESNNNYELFLDID